MSAQTSEGHHPANFYFCLSSQMDCNTSIIGYTKHCYLKLPSPAWISQENQGSIKQCPEEYPSSSVFVLTPGLLNRRAINDLLVYRGVACLLASIRSDVLNVCWLGTWRDKLFTSLFFLCCWRWVRWRRRRHVGGRWWWRHVAGRYHFYIAGSDLMRLDAGSD